MKTYRQFVQEAGRCWTGYKPVLGKEPYSPGSCEKIKQVKKVKEHVIKTDSGYKLVSKKTGKNLGTATSKAGIMKREREVEYFKHVQEGWKEMVKDVKDKHQAEVGSGKFTKKKDPTTGGTIHSIKYDNETGETNYKLSRGQHKGDETILNVDTKPLSKVWNKRHMKEDGMGGGAMGGAPANNVGSGNIAGSGGKGGEPGINLKKKKTPILMPIRTRSAPKM